VVSYPFLKITFLFFAFCTENYLPLCSKGKILRFWCIFNKSYQLFT